MKVISSIRFSVGRLKASVIVCSIVVILLNYVDKSSCFKTMNSVHQMASNVQQVSYNKVHGMWKPEAHKKPFHTTVIVNSNDTNCDLSSSKHVSKCRKRKPQKSTKHRRHESQHKSKASSQLTGSSNTNVIPQTPKNLMNIKNITPENLKEISKFIQKKRHYCKHKNFNGFPCQKLKLSTWLTKQMNKNTTKVNSWLEFVKKADNTTGIPFSARNINEINPSMWPERIVYRLIKAWGAPEDLFAFYKYKEFVNSRELKISLPYDVQLKVSSRDSPQQKNSARSLSVGTGRIFWDPGFNLKLKLPFFRDELKVAVSTGPSFIAGIGVGIVILILKGMFAPMLFGMKWMLYNFFFKESGPFDLMRMFFLSHSPEPWDSSIPPPAIDHYRAPPVHNPFDRRPHGPPGRGRPPPPPPPHHFHHPPHGPFPSYGGPPGPGPTAFDVDYNTNQPQYTHPPFDLKHQFSQAAPIIQTLTGANPTMSQLEQLYRNQLLEEGLGLNRPAYKNMQPDPTNSIDITSPESQLESIQDEHIGQNYIPSTGLQAEVEHFDPFYSPLLSKIDSIFTHLGHNDEGCRERVVCSIYKFPVKYAPYSNLISAQLSKHQTELKRPVTSSPKILRYFRYMKAAKDGQGGESCLELYPKCNSDTDSVSSLPMVTTFHQLSELMTAEASSPGVSLAAAG